MNSTASDAPLNATSAGNITALLPPDIFTNPCGFLPPDVIVLMVRIRMYGVLQTATPLAMGLVSLVSLLLLASLNRLNRYTILNIVTGFIYMFGAIFAITNLIQFDFCALTQLSMWSAFTYCLSFALYNIGGFLIMAYIYLQVINKMAIENVVASNSARIVLLILIFLTQLLTWLASYVGLKFSKTPTNYWKVAQTQKDLNTNLLLSSQIVSIVFYTVTSGLVVRGLHKNSKDFTGTTNEFMKLIFKNSEGRLLISFLFGIINAILGFANTHTKSYSIIGLILILTGLQWGINMTDSIIVVVKGSSMDKTNPKQISGMVINRETNRTSVINTSSGTLSDNTANEKSGAMVEHMSIDLSS
ncbi:hypothetical protein G9A89_019562 [Geosiphon pyriformis]|nr:hypothetical protein G9A89_019562 [Geosiphon pyriformis]